MGILLQFSTSFMWFVEMYSSRCTATLQGRDWFTAGGNTTVMGTLLGITVSTVLARLFVNVNLYSLSSQK